jgi:hypothetical protein
MNLCLFDQEACRELAEQGGLEPLLECAGPTMPPMLNCNAAGALTNIVASRAELAERVLALGAVQAMVSLIDPSASEQPPAVVDQAGALLANLSVSVAGRAAGREAGAPRVAAELFEDPSEQVRSVSAKLIANLAYDDLPNCEAVNDAGGPAALLATLLGGPPVQILDVTVHSDMQVRAVARAAARRLGEGAARALGQSTAQGERRLCGSGCPALCCCCRAPVCSHSAAPPTSRPRPRLRSLTCRISTPLAPARASNRSRARSSTARASPAQLAAAIALRNLTISASCVEAIVEATVEQPAQPQLAQQTPRAAPAPMPGLSALVAALTLGQPHESIKAKASIAAALASCAALVEARAALETNALIEPIVGVLAEALRPVTRAKALKQAGGEQPAVADGAEMSALLVELCTSICTCLRNAALSPACKATIAERTPAISLLVGVIKSAELPSLLAHAAGALQNIQDRSEARPGVPTNPIGAGERSMLKVHQIKQRLHAVGATADEPLPPALAEVDDDMEDAGPGTRTKAAFRLLPAQKLGATHDIKVRCPPPYPLARARARGALGNARARSRRPCPIAPHAPARTRPMPRRS